MGHLRPWGRKLHHEIHCDPFWLIKIYETSVIKILFLFHLENLSPKAWRPLKNRLKKQFSTEIHCDLFWALNILTFRKRGFQSTKFIYRFYKLQLWVIADEGQKLEFRIQPQEFDPHGSYVESPPELDDLQKLLSTK